MTPKDRAQIAVVEIGRYSSSTEVRDLIEEAIQAAVEEEREACAKLADSIATQIWDYAQAVDWGNGTAMLAQLEIERIVREAIHARGEDGWECMIGGHASGCRCFAGEPAKRLKNNR